MCPSVEHQRKIEEIEREIKSRGLQWRTKRNLNVWLPQDNILGKIDLTGFKKFESSISPAIIESYEVEEKNSPGQISRNLEKLRQLEKLRDKNIIVKTCQLTSDQDHKKVCQKNQNKPRTFGVRR